MASLMCARGSCVASATRHISISTPAKSAFHSAARPLTIRAAKASPTLLLRHASSSSASTASNANTTSEEVLTWDRFFDLRRKRRYLNLGTSVVTAGAAIGIFGPIIASQDIDGWAAQISGLDPFIVLGISAFAVATGGWLCGPTAGSAAFKLWAGRKGWNQAIAEKEKSFFARVKRYRADPASSSPQNPLPDFYGEKIGSVKDYRRWLKDQRAFNLKKNKNMI